jgi:hypothetical protein
MLGALVTQWTNYSNMVKSISPFLSSLEWSYTEPENLPNLEITALKIFFSQVSSMQESFSCLHILLLLF